MKWWRMLRGRKGPNFSKLFIVTQAFDKFQRTIRRCEGLIDNYNALAQAAHDQQNAPDPAKDIVRGAVVLSVAALDSWATDAFSEGLTTYLRTRSPDETLVNMLSDAGLDARQALEMINMQRPYRRIATLVRWHHAKHTTQDLKVIDKLFSHYRLPKLSEHAERRSGRLTLRSSVETIVHRRHQIVHEGDYNNHRRLRAVDVRVVGRRIRDIELLVEHMDAIFTRRVWG